MGAESNGKEISDLEVWEREVLAGHRWGNRGDQANEEHTRLKRMWEAIQPVDDSCRAAIGQIVDLEICNWNLEENIFTLCKVIAAKRPAREPIGHMVSLPEERWKKAWAYYLACRDWLSCPVHPASGQKLGGYDLPYSGSGSIIYDIVDSTWTVAFEAPKGWPCTGSGK